MVPFWWRLGIIVYCSFTSTLIEVQVTTPPVNPEIIKSVNLIFVVTWQFPFDGVLTCVLPTGTIPQNNQNCFPLSNVTSFPGVSRYAPTGVFVIIHDVTPLRRMMVKKSFFIVLSWTDFKKKILHLNEIAITCCHDVNVRDEYISIIVFDFVIDEFAI